MVAAGYALYGSATMIVLTTGGNTVNGFTLDPVSTGTSVSLVLYSNAVEPLYCGHHWAEKKTNVSSLERCPYFRGSFVHKRSILFWDLGNCPD